MLGKLHIGGQGKSQFREPLGAVAGEVGDGVPGSPLTSRRPEGGPTSLSVLRTVANVTI